MANNKFADFIINNEKAIENTDTAVNGVVLNPEAVVGSVQDLTNPSADHVENSINQVGLVNAGASTALGFVETADLVASSGGNRPAIFVNNAENIAKAGSRLGAAGIALDTGTLAYDVYHPEREAKVANVLGSISGGLGVAAVTATGTIAGAPAGAVLLVLSGGFAGASIAVGDLTVNQVNDAVVGGMRAIEAGSTSAIKGGLDLAGRGALSLGSSLMNAGNALEDLFDLPKISGSQQNQLMAISKTPSFNYTSHKKDSVAGYNLYQMLDNAEDTISNSTMNGFTVYVMGQTIQPTCMGDEAGVGGGVKSGTVGKEVRATSGAPSILYCGYLAIRADDTCTMNNENVEGKYISLC